MEYRNLGTAGVKVSPICLGTAFRGQKDDAVCIRTIERALDLGCNFIDTANIYGQGRSERILAKALKGKRDDVFLTSKVTSPVGQGPNDKGFSRYHIMREIERSLERLQTDHLDLYLLHSFDPTTPIDEALRTLNDLVRQGKVRYIGCSNFNAWQIVEALWTSDTHNLEPFVCVQSQYNLLNRWEIEPDLMPVCSKHGLGMMTFSPLAIGLLTGRFRRGQTPPSGTPWEKGKYNFDRAMSAQNDRIVQKLIEIGQNRDRTPAQVAIAWVLDHPEITAAMIGPDTPEHVDENFGGVGWELTPEERSALDEVSELEGPYTYM
jgi:aryl-alcohol dehydrogenase-like predicted oxidoreductase